METIDYVPDEGVENILDVNNDDGTICSKIVHNGTTEVPSIAGNDSGKEDKPSAANTIPINVEFNNTKKKGPLTSMPPKAPKMEEKETVVTETKEVVADEIEEEEERDFDKNPTVLYALVQKKIWKEAVERAKTRPDEASIWVSRREKDGKLRWRLLPLHAAIVFKASEDVIESLLTAFPKGAETKDDQGMLPLHLAFRNGASEAVVNLLLTAHPQSVEIPDRKGRKPITLAQAAAEPHRTIFIKALEKGPSYYAVAAIAAARANIVAEQEQIYEKKLSQVRTVHEYEVSEVRIEEEKKRNELVEKIAELENDLSKTMETSQVLVDHVNSLEAQLASRSDTERFLATKIANLDEKLKQTESMKAENEAAMSAEKSKLIEERDALAAKVDELQKKYDESSSKLERALEKMGNKDVKYTHTEKELREKLNKTEVEWANSKANAAILEAQLKKRMENEHLLASQVSNLASRLAEAAAESNVEIQKYDETISELEEERQSLRVTVEDLTQRLKDAARAMEKMSEQQLKIIDGAITHENIVCQALEAHAKIVTDAARQERELEIAKQERAIIFEVLAKQETAFNFSMEKRKEVSSIVGMQGKNLAETKEARETILSCVQEMSTTMSSALENIMGGIQLGTSASYNDEDEDSVSPIEKEAQEMEGSTLEDGSSPEAVAPTMTAETKEDEEEKIMITETDIAEEGPEMDVAPTKKLEDIMKEIVNTSKIAMPTEDLTETAEARSDEGSSQRVSEGDRIMESREM
ncbi:ankyrin repeat domain protein [Nitzschia inconspicua]|uniref:Ankyrin repeat domain protein n=1 Tax=Nitzschia inconspicua TaxID=303405 RepID=A0A9K3Q0E6_9STRA|nr:ankyrin repeat domain protein [Nitzschia inconspicua]